VAVLPLLIQGVAKHWLGTKGGNLLDLAPAWRTAGAALIGGCCGTDAADINELAIAMEQMTKLGL
jgi:S-methylmethionine-dependent homocysteine/selenocysteine methylase